MWNDELGRARYYLAQAANLLNRAAVDLKIKEIHVLFTQLSELVTPAIWEGHIPDDARTCLHQASLALVNVRGSLIADGKIKEANITNEIRGEIIRWFDFNKEE